MVSGESLFHVNDGFLVHGRANAYGHNIQFRFSLPSVAIQGSIFVPAIYSNIIYNTFFCDSHAMSDDNIKSLFHTA